MPQAVVVVPLPLQAVEVEAGWPWDKGGGDVAELDALQVVVVVVVVGLLPHVDGDEVVELLLVEEVLRLPVDVEVWVQVLLVVEQVVRVLLPEHEPVALHEPQLAPAWDPHKKGSISGQDEAAAQMKLRVQRKSMGLKPI